jgi:hypothetical protein
MTRRKQLVTFACLLLLLGAWDFVGRVYVGRDASLRVFESPQVLPLPDEVGLSVIQGHMAQWFPGSYDSGPDSASGKESLHLSLLGVFARRGLATAVIETRTASGGNRKTMQAVIVGDVVNGFTVKAIEPHEVTLEGEDGTLQLLLFSPSAPGAVAGGDADDVPPPRNNGILQPPSGIPNLVPIRP